MPLTYVLNNLNRGLGLSDSYPFVLSPPVIDKLRFIHDDDLSQARLMWKRLGAGLVTGAADDDPSGIATYSQAGAQFGFQLCWTLLLTYPLMVVIQAISARIGRTTGQGYRREPARALSELAGAVYGDVCCSSPTPSTSELTSGRWRSPGG